MILLAILVIGGLAYFVTAERLAKSSSPRDTALSAFMHAAWISGAYVIASVFSTSGDHRDLADRIPDLLSEGLMVFGLLAAGIVVAFLRFSRNQ